MCTCGGCCRDDDGGVGLVARVLLRVGTKDVPRALFEDVRRPQLLAVALNVRAHGALGEVGEQDAGSSTRVQQRGRERDPLGPSAV